MKNKNKIAIIGAGINGLYLAWKLAEKKEIVSVFEKRKEIGKQACSGLFSEQILKFIPESEKLIENRIKSVFIYFPKKTLNVKFKNNFLVMDHAKLDNLTADLAKQAGAQIFLSREITKNQEIPDSFNRIIGSDGANSTVRKWLGLFNQKFLLGIQGFIEEKNDLNYVEAWPTKKGFIWKIPRGNQTEWGIMEETDKAKIILDEFLKKKNLALKNLKSSLIPQKFLAFHSFKNFKITLCGDAVGLIKPWSGGGVIWGLIAADLLLKSFPNFLKYHKRLKRFFSFKIIFSKIAVRMVYFLGFNLPWLMPKNVKINNDFLI